MKQAQIDNVDTAKTHIGWMFQDGTIPTQAEIEELDKQSKNADSNKTVSLYGARPFAVQTGAKSDPRFLDLHSHIVKQVARVTSVPAPLLDDLSDATYNNIDTLIRDWYRRVIPDRLKLIEDVLNQYIRRYHPDQLVRNVLIQFNTDDVIELQETIEEKVDRLTRLVTAGIIQPAQAAEELGYEVRAA